MSENLPDYEETTSDSRKTNRILWHSNAPWCGVGYGVQTALFTPRIRDLGYDVAISAFFGLEGAQMFWEGMPVLPGDGNWGNRFVASYAAYHGGGNPKGCLTITLMDVWVLQNQFLGDLRLASWVPVDHDPVPPRVVEFFRRHGARPIAMSAFGAVKLAEAGLDPLYIPHGVDTAVYRPVDGAPAREALGIPGDAFLVGMVANNQGFTPPRKAFPEVFEAFARFREKRRDAVLYVHAERTGVRQGVNLDSLARIYGIDGAVFFPPQVELELGIDSASMAEIFSSFDVLVNPSYGEGFGIPIVEAQACGTPVIVNDFTSMPELVGAGWKTEGELVYDAGHGANFKRPNPRSIAGCLEQAYAHAGEEKLRERAVEFAARYDVDVIVREFWVEALEELTAEDRVLEALR
ncbi:MAG TPA: glycosyltransferase [Actinomycetota bacterium]|nr:glycosyltransferase [Actinomycetota bacterium]